MLAMIPRGSLLRIRIGTALALFVLVPSLAKAQAPSVGGISEAVQVIQPGPTVSMPSLLNAEIAPLMAPQCDTRFAGRTVLALIVDAQGKAQNVQFVSPAANNADRLAVAIALLDRFSPGLNDSKPVATSIMLEIKVDGCMIRKQGPNGKPTISVRLRKLPTQELEPYGGFPSLIRYGPQTGLTGIRDASEIREIGKSISHPIPLHTPAAQFSDEGRRKGIHGTCTIEMVVDAHGLPQRPRVVKPLEASMDEQALIAVDQFRFKPAMLDSIEPVPVRITVEVNFQLGSPPM